MADPDSPVAAQSGGIDCLHADDDLLVLAKPSGLLCVPGRGPDKQDCLSRRAQQQWPEALVVHRLDQATSGLVLMARNPEAQRRMGRAFELRQVQKRSTLVNRRSPSATRQPLRNPMAAWTSRPPEESRMRYSV